MWKIPATNCCWFFILNCVNRYPLPSVLSMSASTSLPKPLIETNETAPHQATSVWSFHHSLQTMCCLSKTQSDFFCSSVGDGRWLFNNQSSFALLPKSSPSSFLLLLLLLFLPPPPSPLCSRNIVGEDSSFRNDHAWNSWVVYQLIQS